MLAIGAAKKALMKELEKLFDGEHNVEVEDILLMDALIKTDRMHVERVMREMGVAVKELYK